MIFGAIFVFKISPNFAFKNILENEFLFKNWTFFELIGGEELSPPFIAWEQQKHCSSIT
jgi:hypothetical protein